jgi:hypothetical protein
MATITTFPVPKLVIHGSVLCQTRITHPPELGGSDSTDAAVPAMLVPNSRLKIASWTGMVTAAGGINRLALQLPFFEMGAPSDRLVRSTPE